MTTPNRAVRRRLHDPVLNRMARIAHALDARMGQAQGPLTPQSQQLNVPTSAVASATGTATFTFQSPPQGLTWTGTLTCAGAPGSSTFLAAIGATSWGDWAGNSVYGPVQAFANEQLVVTATGLIPGTSYELVWAGSSDAADKVQPVWPDTNTSALFASISAPAPSAIYGPTALTISGGGVTTPAFSLLSTTRTLIVLVRNPGGAAVTDVIVTGGTTNYEYYNQAPYLTGTSGAGSFAFVVVPIVAVADNTVTVEAATTGASPVTVTVFADTTQYDESVLYNGVATPAASTTTGATLATGPLRLLSAQLSVTAASPTGAYIAINGIPIVQCEAGATASIGPAQPCIVTQTTAVTCVGTTNDFVAQIIHAYP